MDSETAIPLVSANVMLANTVLGAASSYKGIFRIERIPPGRHTLIVSSLGYKVERLDGVVVEIGRSTIRDVALKPIPVEFQEVIVTASRREQTANMTPASVTIVNARDIAARNVTTFHQALEMFLESRFNVAWMPPCSLFLYAALQM